MAPFRGRLADVAKKDPVVAYADEPLRVVVYRMAETGFTRMPVLKSDSDDLVGMISLHDLLRARTRSGRRAPAGARAANPFAVRRGTG